METTLPPVQTPLPTRPISSPTLASRSSRLLAAIVDFAIFLAVWLVAFFTNEPILYIIGVMALAAYQIYLLTVKGQTIGKNLMNIQIVKSENNENGGFVTNVLLRGILNGILYFTLLYIPVDIFFIFREDQRCLHDMIAGTKVVDA